MVELIRVLLEDFLSQAGEGTFFGVEIFGAGGIVLWEKSSQYEILKAGKEDILPCAFLGDLAFCVPRVVIALCGCAVERHFALKTLRSLCICIPPNESSDLYTAIGVIVQ